MDFAKKMLYKYGWKEGEGLGKERQGIAKPIKASLKFDNAGLGMNIGDEFQNHWWERVYNEAADNVELKTGGDGKLKMDLKDDKQSIEISTKAYSLKKMKKSDKRKLYDNNFVASNADGEENMEGNILRTMVMSNEELFKACGGRTAHKGARHGLKLSGKLKRIEQQEAHLLEQMLNRGSQSNGEISSCSRLDNSFNSENDASSKKVQHQKVDYDETNVVCTALDKKRQAHLKEKVLKYAKPKLETQKTFKDTERKNTKKKKSRKHKNCNDPQESSIKLAKIKKNKN